MKTPSQTTIETAAAIQTLSQLQNPSPSPLPPSEANAHCLTQEIQWFQQVLQIRIALYFQQPCDYQNIYQVPPPDLTHDQSDYAQIVQQFGFGFEERLVLMLALMPHVRPQALDQFFFRNTWDRGHTEFGGWKGQHHGGFLPTCETAAFLIAGTDLSKRFNLRQMFESEHPFLSQGILQIESSGRGEPFFSSALLIRSDMLSRLTIGISQKPDYSIEFPAKLITTPLSWNDLVLAPETQEEIERITLWIQQADTVLNKWGLAKHLKPGYRSLFYGPPGTGKTLTASLIGASVGADVYRIDLSAMVSKYIGETEKNLANLFDQAESKHWILFFDEADALFGKRTATRTSNDRHANQEISYLLQRVEDFPGVVILATNLRANIDEAFSRRFQSLVYFPMPEPTERMLLWKKMLSDSVQLANDVDLQALAKQYTIAGGSITNAVRYAALRTLHQQRTAISQQDLIQGIVKELRKEGKTI